MSKYFIASIPVSATVPVVVDPVVERVMIVDCSGSMYSDLRQVKAHMKSKIPTLVRLKDRVSIIFFSSSQDYGWVVKGFEISSGADFKVLNSAIDQYIYARGCTGFKGPIDLATQYSIQAKNQDKIPTVSHMFFMTDGYDNCWRNDEIISSVKKAAETFDSMTIVEYGWSCNRPLLNAMASAVGASQVFSEDFDKFEGAFEDSLVRRVGPGTKKIEVSVPGAVSGDVAFFYEGEEALCVDIAGGKALVPESCKALHYVTVTKQTDSPKDPFLLDAINVMSQRMLSDETLNLLGDLGDKTLIDKFVNCFSKQDYSEFQSMVSAMRKDETLRFPEGRVHNYLPAEDAYTAVDLLEELASDEENLLYIYDENFKYERTTAARVDSHSVVKEEEKEALMEKLKNAKNPEELQEASEELKALTESKVSLKFIPADKTKGYAIKEIGYREDRSNITVRVTIPGYVEIPAGCPMKAELPARINTVIHRQYMMVKDGIKHSSMRVLPMSLCESTFRVLVEQGFLQATEVYTPGKIYLVKANNAPVINRLQVKKVSAQTFFTMSIDLLTLKSSQKVYNSLLKGSDKLPDGFASAFGDDAALWLKERGLTSGGFNPPSVKGESTDQYMATEFKISIAKCSSIPTIDDKLFTKIQSGKALTLSESLCAPALRKYWEFQGSDAVKNAADPAKVTRAWLESEAKATTQVVRAIMKEVAKIKLATMVGHTWFTEFKSLDENTLDVTVEGVTYTCKAVQREIAVSI
jgi:hypothetical protein